MERTTHIERIYEGKILKLERLTVELEDGRPANREIVRHVGAVGVVARRPDGRFVFVRQYRKAVDAMAVEICAGLRQAGEPPEQAAQRELLEETGHRALRLRLLGRLWASPGYTDEEIHIFFAECAGEVETTQPDEDERVDTLLWTPEEVDDRIRRGEIRDAKTLAAWLMYRLGATTP